MHRGGRRYVCVWLYKDITMGPCSEETIIYLDYGDDCKKSHMA